MVLCCNLNNERFWRKIKVKAKAEEYDKGYRPALNQEKDVSHKHWVKRGAG